MLRAKYLKWILPLCAGIIWLPDMPAAFAADYTYAPKGCDFKMVFPEEPGTGQSCNPDNPQLCHQVQVYNKFFAIDSGLRITVSCGRAEPDMLKKYSGEVMQYTLGAMAKSYVDQKTAETAFTDLGEAKQAVLMGSKKQDDGTDSVYMSVMMIGKNSVLSAEGEITGVDNPDADKLFAHIMKSAALQNPAQPAAAGTGTPDTKAPDSKAPDDKNDPKTKAGDSAEPAAPQDKKP